MSDPLVNHLIDLVEAAPSESLIVFGGLGMMLKQAHLIEVGATTLVAELPRARATADIDIFLRIELLCDVNEANNLRATIDDLGYEVQNPNWRFRKPLQPTDRKPDFTLDLHATCPSEGSKIKSDSVRVGKGKNLLIHGRTTPEAFAVGVSPVLIRARDDSRDIEVAVAHPYGWINMKVRAFHDWLRYNRSEMELRKGRNPPASKHVFDVVLLVAMLTEEELNFCESVRESFSDSTIANAIRAEAQELFHSDQSPGWIEAVRQGASGIEHALFWDTLSLVLGLKGASQS